MKRWELECKRLLKENSPFTKAQLQLPERIGLVIHNGDVGSKFDEKYVITKITGDVSDEYLEFVKSNNCMKRLTENIWNKISDCDKLRMVKGLIYLRTVGRVLGNDLIMCENKS